MKIVLQVPKPRSDAAHMLADRRYLNRVVSDKKKYSRKGRKSSKQFGDSFYFSSMVTGQWSEPITFGKIFADFNFEDNFLETNQ